MPAATVFATPSSASGLLQATQGMGAESNPTGARAVVRGQAASSLSFMA